jgi:hypothetical protein
VRQILDDEGREQSRLDRQLARDQPCTIALLVRALEHVAQPVGGEIRWVGIAA